MHVDVVGFKKEFWRRQMATVMTARVSVVGIPATVMYAVTWQDVLAMEVASLWIAIRLLLVRHCFKPEAFNPTID